MMSQNKLNARKWLSNFALTLILPCTLTILLLSICVLAWLSGSVYVRAMNEALIMMGIVVGVYTFTGNSGIFSFGHVGFVAIGAYAEAWQTCCPALKPVMLYGLPNFLLNTTIPTPLAVLLSGSLAALTALTIGLVIMRLSGLAAAISTFAFLSIVGVVLSNWDSITLGTGSVVGIPLILNIWAVLACVSALIVASSLFQSSRFGLMLRASRDDEVAAQGSGVNLYLSKLIAFVISAFIAGISGALFAHFLGILTVDAFYLKMTVITLAMLVIGGINSLTGAVVGVLIVSGLTEILRQVEGGISIGGVDLSLPSGSQQVALGLAMLLIVLLRPSGVTGGKELSVQGVSNLLQKNSATDRG